METVDYTENLMTRVFSSAKNTLQWFGGVFWLLSIFFVGMFKSALILTPV